MTGWMDGWMDGRMDGWMDGLMDVVTLWVCVNYNWLVIRWVM